MSYDHLSHDELARLLPELLLCGHLIDRSGMAHVIGALGREGMGEVAIEEWRGASPVYTRRMREALGLSGHGVTDLFKCFQHDIGAPPQFLDFRFSVEDEHHGGFHLDHCGALLDVEPMGEEYVVTMCHHIEDPTFDATALVTSPYAQVRPVHRPPRVPTDRHPHCAWTVTIDETRDPLSFPTEAAEIARTHAATFPLPGGSGGYEGPLQADVDWTGFPRALLLRLCDEIALQWHLLSLSFARAVGRRTPEVDAIVAKQLTGIAGLTSWRLRGLGLESVLAVHPVLNPVGYVGVTVEGRTLTFDRTSPGAQDGWWVRLLGEAPYAALDALVLGVDPTLGLEVVEDTRARLVVHVVETGAARGESPEVAVTRFSKGADFVLVDRRRMLPISPA